MFRNFFSNPYFLLLLAGNAYCIWYFNSHTNGFVTVIWIYWIQSIIIGFFNFVELYSIKNYDAGTLQLNSVPVTTKNKGCLPWFFMFHYGFFHFVYAIFLMVGFGISSVDKTFLLIGVSAFLFEALSGFLRRKALSGEVPVNLGALFFLPYLRVVPMHLVILAPVFFDIQPSIIFLILKTIADVLSYWLYQRIYFKGAVVS